MKKTVAILLTLLMLAALLAACAKTEQPAGTQAPETKAPETEAVPEGVYVAFNGVNLVPGGPFAELKDKLGAETKPAETIDSCDENSDWQQTSHYYGDVRITENKDGMVEGIEVSGSSDAALNGVIRIGTTADEVKAVLGEPGTDQPWGLYYEDLPMVNVFLDEETGKVTGFMVMNSFIM